MQPKIISQDTHGIKPESIKEEVRTIIATLQDAGHAAYLVGGGVRDLVLGKQPVDFDVVTSALPNDVKKLFRRCSLVGKRFVLAHVYTNDSPPTEISTFRAKPTSGDTESSAHHEVDAEGRIVKGNLYGESLEDDVVNRDFTCNALYYNPEKQEIIDLTGGYEDCLKGQLTFINKDMAASIAEDPARILRFIRFAQLLEYTPTTDQHAILIEHIAKIESIPVARRIVELVKMFHSGRGYSAYQMLESLSLIKPLFGSEIPSEEDDEEETPLHKFIRLGLQNTDQRINSGNHTSRAFLMAILYWPHAMIQFEHALPESNKIYSCARTLFSSYLRGLPNVYQNMLLTIWTSQTKFRELTPEKIPGFCKQRHFRAAYDFYLVRVQSGLESEQRLDLWTQSRDQYAPANQELNNRPRRKNQDSWRNRSQRRSGGKRHHYGNNGNNGNRGNRSSKSMRNENSNINGNTIDNQVNQAEKAYESYQGNNDDTQNESAVATTNRFNLLDNS